MAGPLREVGGVKKEGVVSLQEVNTYNLPGRPGIESCRYTRVLFTETWMKIGNFWKSVIMSRLLSHPNLLLVVPVRILSIINFPNFLSLSATRVTVLLLLKSCDLLCVGTEGGGVYFLEVPSLSLKDNQTLLQDQITHRWDCYTKGINTKKHEQRDNSSTDQAINLCLFLLTYTVKQKNLVDTAAKLILEWNT